MRRASMVFFMFVSVAACTPVAIADEPRARLGDVSETTSLYDRLGGKTGITAVVNDFVRNVGADKRLNSFFAAAIADPERMRRFKNNLVNQICEAAKGPCNYTGLAMREAHKNMGVTYDHFGAMVENLAKALDKNNVARFERSELLGLIGPMHRDIVQSATRP